MTWLKNLSSKRPQEVQVPGVQFIGEQDGPPEQLLKKELSEQFQKDKDVIRAYLAKIKIGEQAGVSLCLRNHLGPNQGLAQKIGSIFGMIFNASEHLDIMFLTDAQESDLIKVCSPFFRSSDKDDSVT